MVGDVVELPVVLVTHTVMSGQVVRWYTRPEAEVGTWTPLSASRNGVYPTLALHQIPPAVLAVAKAAYEELSRNRDADMSRLATHRRVSMSGAALEPIGGAS